jgi:hypothetical protein
VIKLLSLPQAAIVIGWTLLAESMHHVSKAFRRSLLGLEISHPAICGSILPAGCNLGLTQLAIQLESDSGVVPT